MITDLRAGAMRDRHWNQLARTLTRCDYAADDDDDGDDDGDDDDDDGDDDDVPLIFLIRLYDELQNDEIDDDSSLDLVNLTLGDIMDTEPWASEVMNHR